MNTRRVLVTGSRDWTDRRSVWFALFAQFLDTPEDTTLIVVHGDCPTGADKIARDWCRSPEIRGLVIEEAHPADWGRPCTEECSHRPRMKDGKRYCPMAGNLRNQEMVDCGAYVCLAFPLPESRGTVDCMKRAKKAKIPVVLGDHSTGRL